MTDNQMNVRMTAWITTGVLLFFMSLFGWVTISGHYDAKVNQAQYVAAVQACSHASDVTACLSLVNNAFHNSAGN